VPWNYVTKPTTFITVLSGWSVFLSPMTGIVIGDYFLVRNRDYRLGDLYTGNSDSAYWYTAGLNWRGILAWMIGIAPTLLGFVRAVRETRDDTSAWDHLYNMTYFYGFFSACLVYAGLHWLFPGPRQTGHSDFVLPEHAQITPGQDCCPAGEFERREIEPDKFDV
jgi:nucleobase:cation symporter-1, NCS1 family